jgi:hypothetical protein
MMDDDQTDDAPKKTPPTPEEVAEYEQAVRHLIRRRAAFDPHLKFLRDMLEDKAGQEDDEQ